MGQINSNIVSDFLSRTSAFAFKTKLHNSQATESSSSDDSSDSDSSSAVDLSLQDSDSGVSDVPSSIPSSGVSDSSSYTAFIAYQLRTPPRYDYYPAPSLGLPDPEPGSRPCWEPPCFSYSKYEDVLQAHSVITRKEGSVDIIPRTLILDNALEGQLIDDYLEYAKACQEEAEETESWETMDFYEALAFELRIDDEELKAERDGIVQMVGEEDVNRLERMLGEEIDVARRNRGLTAFADMWECDGSD